MRYTRLMLTCPSDHTGKTQKMLVTKCQLVLDMSSYFFYFYFYFYFILFYFYFFFIFFTQTWNIEAVY